MKILFKKKQNKTRYTRGAIKKNNKQLSIYNAQPNLKEEKKELITFMDKYTKYQNSLE